MVNSVWNRYMKTNLRHQSVKKYYKKTKLMFNSVWHRYINTNLRYQSIKLTLQIHQMANSV